MEWSEIIEQLKLLNKSGMKIAVMESKIGLPRNNLSGIINGTRKPSKKSKEKFEAFFRDIENPPTFSYLTVEKERQLLLMKSLGIPVEAALFEQCINTVIMMAADYKAKFEALKKEIETDPTPPPSNQKLYSVTEIERMLAKGHPKEEVDAALESNIKMPPKLSPSQYQTLKRKNNERKE